MFGLWPVESIDVTMPVLDAYVLDYILFKLRTRFISGTVPDSILGLNWRITAKG